MGRKRMFDVEKALDTAMREFKKNGYERTRISDICDIVGITKPGIYRAFKSKDALFQRALEQCGQRQFVFITQALNASTLVDVVRQVFSRVIELSTRPGEPPGSLLLSATVAFTPECMAIRSWLADWRGNLEIALAGRFAQAVQESDLATQVCPDGLARYVMSVCAGLALQAEGGISQAVLREIADIALQALPAVGADT